MKQTVNEETLFQKIDNKLKEFFYLLEQDFCHITLSFRLKFYQTQGRSFII